MNPTGRNSGDHRMKLLSHQAALVDTFFGPASKRVILLRGDVGLGKTIALTAIISRLLREQPRTRILLLCPAALRFHWAEVLSGEDTPALIVDRYKFREMLDTSTGDEFWPRGVATILSDDFARQPDIRDCLVGTQWDLVIADEAHRFTRTRAELLRRVGGTAERVVIVAMPGMVPPDGFPIEDATVVEWRRDQVVDHDGKPLDAVPRPALHEVCFSLSPAERDLSETVGTLRQVLEAGTPQQRLVAKQLLHSLHSSLAALEGVLRRHMTALEEQNEIDAFLEDVDEIVGEERSTEPIVPIATEETRTIAGQVLQQLEDIQGDSRFDAFGSLLGDLGRAETSPRRICVLTEYVGTLYYLAAEIEERGLVCLLLHSGMSNESRHESLITFENTGGILVVTTAMMARGFGLPYVTDLVLYDLPANELVFGQILGRFDRFGRNSQLNVYALMQSEGTDRARFESLHLLLSRIP